MIKLRRIAVAMALSALVGPSGAYAAVADQCLSHEEVSLSARMASVMSIGAALQRCGSCLGERYAQAVQHYEDEGLLKDFWAAQAKIQGQEKIDYVDNLVRQSARDRTASLSATCEACQGMADTLDGLKSDEARAKFYEVEQGEIAKARDFKPCP